ncbi:MAG TPA: hypothetical protein VFX96_16845 [Pyrinomonadaceae bacterium]|nr:hypothetical protein [Pyrinomonadaceae bacterium]
MSLFLYQLCLVIFLLQGVSIPFLIVASGLLWWRHSRRLEALGKELEGARREGIKEDKLFERALEELPELRPLKCRNCGAGLLLRKTETLCPHCDTRGELPGDYAAAVSLKTRIAGLLKSASRHWRAASILTSRPVHWLFLLLIFVEPFVLFPAVLIGSNTYPDTWMDKTFEAMGERVTFLLMLAAFFGFIVWMILFIFLAGLGKSLRAKLPVVPVFEGETRGREAAACRTCGGPVEYGAGDFACVCDFCNVLNFRVRFVSRERARAEARETQTKSALFGAMEILEDFVGTFFFVAAILAVASVLLSLYYAVKNLL